MKATAAIVALACASLAAETSPTPSKAPTEWAIVRTNEIARWKSDNQAAAGVVADAKTRSVRMLVESTGVEKNEIVEFLAIGPLSDRAYESMFVTVASPADIAAAFDRVGMPRGSSPDPFKARLWPEGENLELSFRRLGGGKDWCRFPGTLLKDVKAAEEGDALASPVVWTGGARDDAGQPVASTNMPCAVFALYGHAPSLLQLNGLYDQTTAYGRFQCAESHVRGELFELQASWNGKARVKSVEPMVGVDNAAAKLSELKALAADHDVYVRLAFEPKVTVADAARLAKAFELLDGNGLKLNGQAEGQFYFRAFLPDPAWRERQGRIFQPFEVRVSPDGVRSFVYVEEDWSGEGIDPVLKPKTTIFKDWKELPGLIAKTGEQGGKVTVMFIFAPGGLPVAELTPVLKALGSRINTFYVFSD